MVDLTERNSFEIYFIYTRMTLPGKKKYEERGMFGEHERCVRVAQGIAESNSCFLSALQTSQVLYI